MSLYSYVGINLMNKIIGSFLQESGAGRGRAWETISRSQNVEGIEKIKQEYFQIPNITQN